MQQLLTALETATEAADAQFQRDWAHEIQSMRIEVLFEAGRLDDRTHRGRQIVQEVQLFPAALMRLADRLGSELRRGDVEECRLAGADIALNNH